MFITSLTYLKFIMLRRWLLIGAITILGVAVTTGFVWLQTDQAIAPPTIRVMDWLWRVFICQC